MKAMKVQVKLFATSSEDMGRVKELEYTEEIPVARVLNDLSISESDVGILLVNGIHRGTDYRLHDHDALAITPSLLHH